jgi:hypothetical protein
VRYSGLPKALNFIDALAADDDSIARLLGRQGNEASWPRNIDAEISLQVPPIVTLETDSGLEEGRIFPTSVATPTIPLAR